MAMSLTSLPDKHLVCRPARRRAFAQQCDSHERRQQHAPDQCEAVGVSHDRRLPADRLPDRNDRAVHRARRVRVPVRHEVALQVGESVARRRFEQ